MAESSDTAEAARDVRAIGLIESGETKKAIQLLCTPIANFYCIYGTLAGKDEQRSKLRVLIEELVSTNKIVTDEMTNHMANFGKAKRSVQE